MRYHALAVADTGGWVAIGADQLCGARTSRPPGNGMKIGIIDDGLDAAHPYFDPSRVPVPARVPEGADQVHDAEGDRPADVRAARIRCGSTRTCRSTRVNSFHATHVAGIAAGDYGANAHGDPISGVAPNAYLGNYKALTIPTPGVGLDGNSAEIAAAIEAAVATA